MRVFCSDKERASRRRRQAVPDLPFWSFFDPATWRILATSTDAPVAPRTGAPVLDRALDRWALDAHGALQQAYYGPSLEGLPHGWLPPAFEAEACVHAHGDLLHLVSGRTLLGTVRVLRSPQVSDGAPHENQ